MSITVWHVGSPTPLKLVDAAEFSTDDSGVLRVVNEADVVVAVFAATKWSAAIKLAD